MDQARQDAARKEIERLGREGDALGLLLRRAGAHFGAADHAGSDPIELWGRRIGRLLAVAVCVALCAYLYVVYVN